MRTTAACDAPHTHPSAASSQEQAWVRKEAKQIMDGER
jgi:hypothetical protein